jgi:hypothetical protein
LSTIVVSEIYPIRLGLIPFKTVSGQPKLDDSGTGFEFRRGIMFRIHYNYTDPNIIRPKHKSDSSAVWMLTAILMALFVFLSACREDNAEGSGISEPAASSWVRIISPLPNETLNGDVLSIKVEVGNFVLDPQAIGALSVPGRGHIHLILDGDQAGISADGEFIVKGVALGPHHIKVALANNDHSLVIPAVEDSVIINMSPSDSQESSANDVTNKPYSSTPSPHFVSSLPEDGQKLHEVPDAISISFDFDLAPESTIEVSRDGTPVTTGPVEIASDLRSMSAAIESGGAGTWVVSYKPCWPHYNCHSGNFVFIVESTQPDYSEEGY